MKLTIGEYCQFNLKSRKRLLNEHGKFITRKRISSTQEVRVFSIHGFYVEALYDNTQITKIEPLWNKGMVNYYKNAGSLN